MLSPVATYVVPQTLDQLKQLQLLIEQGLAPISLGRKALEVLRALLRMPAHVAVSTISELSTELQVNPSTLTRLAKKLGYQGFNDFQALFRRQVTSDSQPFSEKADRWISHHAESDTGFAVLQQISRDEIHNLNVMADGLDADVMDRVSDLLAGARCVQFFGARLFYSLASFNAYCLGLIRSQTGVLAESGRGVAHGLAQLQAGDVLVLMGAAPHSAVTVNLARAARRKGIQVIAITDSPLSPLAQSAQLSLVAPTTGSFFANNVASYVILSEALLVQVASKLGSGAVQRLQDQERLVEELGMGVQADENFD